MRYYEAWITSHNMKMKWFIAAAHRDLIFSLMIFHYCCRNDIDLENPYPCLLVNRRYFALSLWPLWRSHSVLLGTFDVKKKPWTDSDGSELMNMYFFRSRTRSTVLFFLGKCYISLGWIIFLRKTKDVIMNANGVIESEDFLGIKRLSVDWNYWEDRSV